MEVGAHQALDLARDRPTFGLYLDLPRGPRFCALGDLDGIGYRVGRRASQSFTVMPRTAIFLTNFWLYASSASRR